jgi:hypothetical protein
LTGLSHRRARRRLHGLALSWFALAGASTPVAAQATKFNPSIEVEQIFTNNADIGVEGEAESDSVTRYSAELPVSREWRRGSWFFSYSPGYEVSRENDDLDHDTHELRFNLATEPSRTSSLAFNLSASRTQYDPQPELIEGTDVFLTRRTDRDLYFAGVSYGVDDLGGGRWSWTADADVFRAEYDEISGLEEDDSAPEPQGRTAYGAGFQLDREVSRRTAVGGRIEVNHFVLDETDDAFAESEDETAYAATLTMRRELSETSGWRAGLGVFATSTDDAGPGDPAELDDDGEVGIQASASYSRELRSVRLSLGASHRPTAGGALQGTSTDSAVTLGLSGRFQRKWKWNWSMRGAHRNPRDDDPSVISLATGGGFERFFARVLGFTVDADWSRQEIEDFEEETISVVRGAIGLVYYPLGRTQLGGG